MMSSTSRHFLKHKEEFPPLQCSNAFLPWLIETGSLESEGTLRRVQSLVSRRPVGLLQQCSSDEDAESASNGTHI